MDIYNHKLFEKLIREADEWPFSGWDFSYIAARWREDHLPWDYHHRVQEAMTSAHCLLDMGTGGGEVLSSFYKLPPETYASEAYPPNVPLAKARLEPLGVHVVAIEEDENLPFEDSFFDLVINRHEKFISTEVFRVLESGGGFITQQVGERNLRALNECLQGEVNERPSSYQRALHYLEEAGMEVVNHQEDFPETVFFDVGAVVYLLKAVPWQVDGFSVEKFYDQLAAIHNHIQTKGEFSTTGHRYYIEARKP